ncbi:MAG: type I DNA topoisomerase [Candidatus Latescibacterota bacterium]|nr:MAG: type I DNA topoisomerase [Candidatus Latescibacterota bacterium]
MFSRPRRVRGRGTKGLEDSRAALCKGNGSPVPKSLVIVESPAKARTIKKYLGKDYEVKASVGHVIDLPKSELGVDVDNGFEPKYVTIKGKGKVVKELKSAGKKVEQVLIATDLDREGEAIAWHLANVLREVQPNVQRIIFNEITKRAIQDAIGHPGEVDQRKVDAQQARRILDRLVGYMVSPILWQVFYYGLSAGRVQSVALRLICEREREILAFTPEEFWSITARLSTSGRDFDAKLRTWKGEKVDLKSKEATDAVLAGLQNAEFSVAQVEVKEKKRNPYPPYITSTMQQDAARRLRFSAKKTMMLAQQLYEGVELGEEGPVGLITYMRTDSTRLSDQARQEGVEYIQQSFGDDYVPEKERKFKKKRSAQDAHEAIRPTAVDRAPDQVRRFLTADQFALYDLVWRRFTASLMSSAVYRNTAADIAAGAGIFRATGSELRFDGYLRVYPDVREKEEGEGVLPALKKGQRVDLRQLLPRQHFTEPPPRYTEASLIRELEEKGIGRPSTYATIVSTIRDREYVTKEGGRFQPTDLGMEVWQALEKSFPAIFEVDFTARMETELDKVETGEDDWRKVVGDFYGPFSKVLGTLQKNPDALKELLGHDETVTCEKCGSAMIKKWGRNGPFLACPQYPKCRNTKSLDGNDATVKLGKQCPDCGGDLVKKRGRYGEFGACDNYPDCKYTEPLSIGVDCPRQECSGYLTKKRSGRGRIFYGCSRYPDCDYASWDKPTGEKCPSCGDGNLVEKNTKAKGIFKKCPTCKEEFVD